jgi:hypothetical protein
VPAVNATLLAVVVVEAVVIVPKNDIESGNPAMTGFCVAVI